MPRWTFGRKIGVGFAIMAIVLVVVAVTGYGSTSSLIANDELVDHTQRVRRQLAELLTDLVDAETGQRGFVITARDEFLEPYHTALSTLDQTYADLQRLTKDNPNQVRRLAGLRPLIDSKLAELKRTIEQRRTTSFEATASTVAGGEGKQLMDRIRAFLRDMDQEEVKLLEQRARQARASSEITQLIIGWGTTAAVVLAIVVGWVIARSLSKQVGWSVQHIRSSSLELQAAANQQVTGARDQTTAMTEITTTINELLATARQIAVRAKHVAQIAGQTTTAARTGEITVVKGHEASNIARKQVDLIVGHMIDLGKKSQQVNDVLDIVAELAEQTNILAINATIEAAGAGDAGARFGVVADEIRKLADRVTASTKEIRSIIDEVRSAVNTTVMATETGSKAVDTGNAGVAEMATAFQQIADLIVTTTDAAREIELSTNQQATAVEQVNQAITSVTGASRETEASTTQTLQTAAGLTELSTSLLRIVHSDESAFQAAPSATRASARRRDAGRHLEP